MSQVDSFEECDVRWLVNNFYITENERLTLKTIYSKAIDGIDFQGTLSSLQRLTVKLGFKLAEPKTTKKLLLKGIETDHLEFCM
jgi:hypothetical protein